MTAPADWQLGQRLYIGGRWVEIMPDTHLGRAFTTDVPLHRRGDREAFVWNDFETRMMGIDRDTALHVHLGDLFDATRVSPATVIRAADIYQRAVARCPGTVFVVQAGNHDIGRDFQASSFDLFARLVPSVVQIVRDEPLVLPGGFAFCPWSPTRKAEELVSALPAAVEISAVFGHWDLTGQSDNLIPVQALASRTRLAITGHDHKRRFERRGEIEVIAAGSMQPYAHGEGAMYWSGLLADLPADTRELCLRIYLRAGETLPDDLDAFQISTKLVTDISEDMLPELQSLDFNVSGLLTEAFARNSVPKFIVDLLHEKRHAAS